MTGSSSGIGKATAALLAANGAKVAVTGRNKEALDSVVAQISASGGQAKAFPGDCTADSEVASIVSSAADWAGGLDILVNSAGVLKGGPADTSSMETWDANMNVNARYLPARALCDVQR